jgi:hypothetical protein
MAFTFIEEWDRTHLQQLLQVVHEPASRHLLCSLLQHLDGQFNSVEYEQKYTDGRYYASYPSAQSLNGKLRRLYFYNKAIDIDIVNCFPTLLQQICDQLHVPCPYIAAYNQKPKFYQLELSTAVGDVTLSAKLYFICMLHGGDLRISETEEQLASCYLNAEDVYPFVRLIRMEFDSLFVALRVHYASILEAAKTMAEQAGSTNIQGRFFHLLLSVQENACLMAMKDHASSDGRSLVGLWYDGLMLWHGPEDSIERPIDLSEFESAILESTGFRLSLAIKSLEPTASDREWLGRSQLRANEEIIHNRTYNSSLRVEPYADFGPGDKGWLLVSASMGAGKTHQMMLYIKSWFTKKPKCRMLIPTSRIVQSIMYRSLLGGVSVAGVPIPVITYREPNFLKQSQFKPGVVICEYESLHLLLKPTDENPVGGCMAFDVVILDEMGGLMSTLISPTNGFNLVANYTAFCFMARTAKQVLGLCADMFYTPVVPEFVLGIVPQHMVRAIIYTSQIVARTYIIYPENTSLVEWQGLLWDSVRARQDDMDAPRVAVLTRTKIAVDSFLQQLSTEFENEPNIHEQFVVVTRDTSQSQMERFSQIDTLFDGKLGIVASPKITSATDIQLPHVVFMDIRGIDGASVRSLGQASGRVRKAHKETIHVMQPYYKPAPMAVEPTKEECKSIVLRREAGRVNTMAAFRNEIELQSRVVPGFEEFGPVEIFSIREPTDPNLVNLVANITRESKLSSRAHFVSQWQSWVITKGFDLCFAEREIDGPSDESLRLHAEAKLGLKCARAVVKEEHAATEVRVLSELRVECTTLGDIDRAYAQMKTLQAQDSGLSSEQTLRLMMLSALSKFPSFFGELDIDQIRYTMKHSSVLYAATVCNTLDPQQIQDLDVVNAAKSPLLADSGLIGVTVKIATELITLGGGTGIIPTDDYPIDLTTYLEPGRLSRFRTLMGRARDSLKSISSSSVRKSRAAKEDVKMVKGELRSILSRIGVKLDAETPRGCVKYRVVPIPMVATLLEHISFRSLDPTVDSGSDTVRELLMREKQYARLLDAVQQSTDSQEKQLFKVGARTAKRRRTS